MNKKMKRIIAMVLTISAFSAIGPEKYFKFMTTEAHAEITGADLESISLGTGSIKFKRKVTEYKLQVNSSVDKLKVKAVPKEDDAQVKINGKEVSESDDYKTIIDLDKGEENLITIKVQNGTRKKTYTIKVIRGELKAEKESYLKNINLDEGNINFSKDKTSYDVNVESDVEEITIEATPEDDAYDVEINGQTVYEGNDYKKTIDLKKGNNKVEIKVQDNNDHEKTYSLNINRGKIETSNKQSSEKQNSNEKASNNTDSKEQKVSEKVSNNTGTSVEAAKGWVSNNGQWYYINEKGNKDTGWKQVGDSWYYLDTNGVMKTSWQSINNEWYYLESNGQMKTGWFNDSDGRWYYLYNSGIMAKNTVIDGYKLNSNGVWVK